MAMVAEVVTLVSQLIITCNTILQIVLGLKALGRTSNSFHSDVVALKAKLQVYEEQVNNHGDLVNDHVVIILRKAKLSLLKVESKMNYLKENFDNTEGCFWRVCLYAKLFMTLFLPRLDKAIRCVKEDLENMSEIMKEEPRIISQFQRNANLLPIPTRILNNDKKYVPIEDSQNAVLTAIENFNGPRIVLLYGGVGKGKSILSKYVCELYGKSGDRKDIFHFVLFVNCAGSSKLDPSNKQYEILRHLSPASLSISPESEKNDFRNRIAQSLQDFFLSDKKILIVLDDVSDAHFISEMWKASEGGTQVRYLVTSQYPNLCDSFKTYSLAIPMGDPNETEAMQILASLVGFEEKVIPEKLQNIAAKMIEATGGNPLALACLASNFAYNRDKTNERAWKDAYQELCRILDLRETTIVLGGSPDTQRSLWAAMKICLDSLESSDAKDILFLLYACEGGAIPEEVLRILHAATNTSNGIFLKAIEELRSRELLKCSLNSTAHKMNIHHGNDTTDQQGPSAWSLLTTVKLYMSHNMASEEKTRSVCNALLGADEINAAKFLLKHEGGSETEAMKKEKAKVAIALCALYFDKDHNDQVVAQVATQACDISKVNWTATVKDLRRKALEPLIWLMDQLEEEDLGWTESTIHCARQVFLRYICDRELDDNNICCLLQVTSYPSAQLATLTALADILGIEETPLLRNDHLTFLEPLVQLLKCSETVQPNIREAASKAMLGIAHNAQGDERKELSKSIVESTPHLLTILVSTLKDSLATGSIPQLNILAQHATNILWCLSYGGNEVVRNQILSENGALEALVKSLFKDADPILQHNTAGALGNLAIGESSKLKILSEDGVLQGLTLALSSKQSPELQEVAARALVHLAAGKSTKLRLLGEDGMLNGLVRALSNQQSPKLQTQAARALANLTAGPDAPTERIMNEDGVLAGLVRALASEQSPKLQEGAAMALVHLGAGKSTKLKILEADGMLEGLVRALSNAASPELQTQAVRALGNLATGPESPKEKIMKEDGVLAGIVKALSSEQSPELQVGAARALVNLPAGELTQLRSLEEDGVLEGLVRALSNEESPELQRAPLRALGNLATGPDSAKEMIINKDGVLGGFVRALSTEERREVQEGAARVLGHLAAGESTQLRILEEDGVLEALVRALSNEESPKLQRAAVRALGNLASGQDSAKERITNEDGVLAGLVRALSSEQSLILQEGAAMALANLGAGKSTKLRILEEDGVLEGLLTAISNEQKPNLQTQAMRALCNLAIGPLSAKQMIMKKCGVLAGLVRALSSEESPEVQVGAARALVNLAAGESTQLRILEEDGVLEGLMRALSNEESPELQRTAVRALCNLATGPDSAKEMIINKDGVLGCVVRALSSEESGEVQGGAAWALVRLAAVRALGNLATRPDSAKRMVINSDGVVPGFVRALSREHSPKLQEEAVVAVANLAARDSMEVSGNAGPSAKYEDGLSQKSCTVTLNRLGQREDGSIKLKMRSAESLVVSLTRCVGKEDNPSLAKAAKQALDNLEDAVEPFQDFIEGR